MTLIGEFTRECLAIRVARRINGMDFIEMMADAMIVHGVSEHARSDNVLCSEGYCPMCYRPEMTAKIVR